MKSTLIEMMTAMMPYMRPLVWVVVAAFVLALIGAFAFPKNALTRLARAVVLAGAVFFLGAQAMGAWLGANPSINFGDASRFEFILVPFWQVGLAALIGWGLLRGLAGRKATQA